MKNAVRFRPSKLPAYFLTAPQATARGERLRQRPPLPGSAWLALLLVLFAGIASAPRAAAQNIWLGYNSSWATYSNWNPDAVPNSDTDQAIIDSSKSLSGPTYGDSTSLQIPITLNTLTFDSLLPSPAPLYFVISTPPAVAGTLTFAGIAPSLTITAAYDGTATIDSPMILGSSLSILNNGTSAGPQLTLAGNVDLAGSSMTFSGAGNTSISGIIIDSVGGGNLALSSGVLTLSGINTYTGLTTVSGGTLLLSGTGTLGAATAALTVSGGTLDLGGAAPNDIGTVTISGGNIQNGTLTSAVDYAGQSGMVSATLAGNVGLDKTTIGTLTLSGVNTYTGSTTISDGTLTLNGTVADTSGVAIFSGGVFDINSTVDGLQVAINSNGTAGFYGNATAGNATITDAGTASFNDYATADTALITNNGALAFNDNATAGSAVITTNNGAQAFFNDSATGGSATIITNAGGVFDLSGLSDGGLAVGSIAGAGNYYLGSNNLTAGSLGTNTTVSGVISDGGVAGGTGGSLTKVGAGILALSGNNTYTGGTTVSAGTLEIDGGTAAASEVDVGSGATLSGNGSIGGNVVLNTGAILNPGATGQGLGTLTVANLTWNGSTDGSATMKFALSNSSNASALLAINGTLAQGGGTDFIFDFEGTGYFDGVDVTNPNIYTLMDFGADSGFTVSDFGYTNLGAGLRGSFILNGNDLQFAVIPEPAAWGVLLGGVALLAAWRRKRS